MRLEHPEWAKDSLTTHTYIYFGWRSRLRILCGKRVVVRNKIYAEHFIGRTLDEEAEIEVAPLWGRGSYAVSEEDTK